MKQFTNQDVENYYDQSEVHYKLFWKLKESMGLHYGIWNTDTKKIQGAVLNTNYLLMKMGAIQSTDYVLDAGCGIGGSAIFNAKNTGCRVHGISLSKKQIATATLLAKENGLAHQLSFTQQDYTKTNFEANTFDVVWAIESMQTASNKNLFYKEMYRILKPGGKILIADIFKPTPYNIAPEKDMHTMLNGWAMTDILAIPELKQIANDNNFEVGEIKNVTQEIKKSVDKIFVASILGMFGTKLYNLFYNASYFSKIHYKTGLAQKKTYYQGKWGYYLIALNKK